MTSKTEKEQSVKASPTEVALKRYRAEIVKGTTPNQAGFRKLLESPGMKRQVESALPAMVRGALTPERLIRIAGTQVTNSPKILECNTVSVIASIMRAAQLGLEPDGDACALVPYKGQCQLIIMYKGLIQLAMRSPRVKSIEAQVVYENDHFEIQHGTEKKLIHRPEIIKERGEMVGAYAVAMLTEKVFHFMRADEIQKIQKQHDRGKRDDRPWKAYPAEMWRKTVTRNLIKYLPMNDSDARREAARDELLDIGKAKPDHIDAIAEELTGQALEGGE